MGDYMALSWPAEVSAAAEARALCGKLEATGGWRVAWESPGLCVLIGGRGPGVREIAGVGIVLGHCLAAGKTAGFDGAGASATSSPRAIAAGLAREAWGAYVALIPDRCGLAVFRDPSGGLDALAWRRGRVQIVTSAPSELPGAILPERIGLDWSAIAAWIAEPGSASTRLGLDRIEAVAPGALMQWTDAGAGSEAIWAPSAHAAWQGPRPDAAGELAERVDLAVRGLVSRYDGFLGEISGGLDSAVVAASLAGQDLAARTRGWMNYYGDRPEGDERPYALAVAETLGLELDCRAKAPTALREEDFTEVARGLRPCLNAVDPVRDRDTAARLAALGAQALVSGQGGDVVFFQMPTPLVAADRARLLGLRSLGLRTLAETARFSRRSAWEVMGAVGRDLLGCPTAVDRAAAFASDDVRALRTAPSAWVEAAAGLPPAKRYQIEALSHAQLYLGASRRRAAADLVYPLLSQPVVEFCLSLSVAELTEGGRERGLARRAFAGRLPASVIARRSKGDLTALYGRTVAASLEFLKPWLLEGVLCEAGLLDRGRLEATLATDHLIWGGRNSTILICAAIEAWVRHWQTRIPDAASAPRPRPPRKD